MRIRADRRRLPAADQIERRARDCVDSRRQLLDTDRANDAQGEDEVALGIYITNSGFTPEVYAEAISQLEAAGAGAPRGRSIHVALETNGNIDVFDIWESQADFDAFGATLMPILTGLGVEPNAPMVAAVHNVIEG
jgi:hypothetical protein